MAHDLAFCFVPITADGRLCAKEIIGNKKRLTEWQDEFWSHMVQKYPELERGESASVTGRDHIPPRVYKQAAHLNKQGEYILGLLDNINAFNSKKVAEELEAALKKFFPEMGRFVTQTKKYDAAIRSLKADNDELRKEVDSAGKESYKKLLEDAKLRADYENLQRIMDKIPPEIVFMYSGQGRNQDKTRDLER